MLAGAMRGKGPTAGLSGPRNLLRRTGIILWRYGVTTRQMDRALAALTDVLDEFQCGATLPVPAAVLARHPGVLEKYQHRNVELAVHGYTHVDHSQLAPVEQARRLTDARLIHLSRGAPGLGFRGPYLRWNEDTLAALRAAGFLYEGSQALAWDVVGDLDTPEYRHVLGFYGAVSARDYPALPRLDDGLVRIPYCLPDDEALVDRLRLRPGEAMNRVWLEMLGRTHAQGELFTLGLHPERTGVCREGLVATLRKARTLSPGVWIARLDEIARWWVARSQAVVRVAEGERAAGGSRVYHLDVAGPAGVVVLVRGARVLTPTTAWDGEYLLAVGTRVSVQADRRPLIGVSRSSPPSLVSFLRQQGYVVESADERAAYALFLDRPRFAPEDERGLLVELESAACPLVRLGRWPNGARSALCVTGDVDALTAWDYGLRFRGG